MLNVKLYVMKRNGDLIHLGLRVMSDRAFFGKALIPVH